jgi:hypothetical protein
MNCILFRRSNRILLLVHSKFLITEHSVLKECRDCLQLRIEECVDGAITKCISFRWPDRNLLLKPSKFLITFFQRGFHGWGVS